jgi:hypothetical protein
LLCCSCIQYRHPLELGGVYFFINALTGVVSWFVAAMLYSQYFPAGPTELARGADMNTSADNYSAFLNSSASNSTEAGSGASPLSHAMPINAIHATAVATGATMHASKIGDLPLFATVGTLAVIWLVAVVGLSLTIKRDYLHTFVSLQTGYADTQSYFLDSQGDDARRVVIFFCNERQWQAIRDLVRQWVLSVYAAWQALMPAFFTTDLQARIPDDVMPAHAAQDLDVQAPGGRRPTVQNMGLLRRMSHAAPVDVASDSDRGVRRPSQLPNSSSVTDGVSCTMQPATIAAITSLSAAGAAAGTSAARPCNIGVGPPVTMAEIAGEGRGSLSKPHDRPDVPDDDEYLTMPEEVPPEAAE